MRTQIRIVLSLLPQQDVMATYMDFEQWIMCKTYSPQKTGELTRNPHEYLKDDQSDLKIVGN